ncbi:MAG: Gfo/Idh/MocA family oxidoreductase [Planctomycetaceae bacterium]
MNTLERYGLLLVGGAQTHQENYARAFMADGRVRLVGLTDEADVPPRRRELNRRLAAELGAPHLDSLDEALRRDDVHVVCVCAEPERRGRIGARCARAGKHIYLDKPPACDAATARDLVAAVAEQGVLSQMFSIVRTPVAARARKILESGRLGKLVGLHCELFFAKGPAGAADLAKPRREHFPARRFTFIDSKRELFCVGLYPLVLFQWLTGGRMEDVYGTTSNYFFAEHQRNDVEDFACLLMRMSGGIDASVMVGRTGWSSHPSHGIHQVHLIGTDGAATVDAYQPRLEIYSDEPAWTAPAPAHPEDPMGFWSSTQRESGLKEKSDWWPVAGEIESDASYFLDCIDAGRQSDVPASVGAHVVEIIMAGYESAATGRSVAV